MPSTPYVSTFAPWAEADELTGLPASINDETKTRALQVATDILFHFSGRRWPGEGEETIYPRCGPSTWELELPNAPITSITEIRIGGEVVDPAGYRLDADRLLVRLRDPDTTQRLHWPVMSDPTLPSEEQFSVKLKRGVLPAIGGKMAAISLARQFALGWAADAATNSQCMLPRRVTSITRQGVALAVLDPLTLFAEGRTGLSDVDLWLSSVRIGNRERAGAVIDIAGKTSPSWKDNRRSPRRFRREGS